jgi:hypothetical protein
MPDVKLVAGQFYVHFAGIIPTNSPFSRPRRRRTSVEEIQPTKVVVTAQNKGHCSSGFGDEKYLKQRLQSGRGGTTLCALFGKTPNFVADCHSLKRLIYGS